MAGGLCGMTMGVYFNLHDAAMLTVDQTLAET